MRRPSEQPTFDQARLRGAVGKVVLLSAIEVTDDDDLDAARVALLAKEYRALGRFLHRPAVTNSGKIVHGHHRIAAARLAGAGALDVEVFPDGLDPALVREVQLSENLVRGEYPTGVLSRMRAEFAELVASRLSGPQGGSEIRPVKARGHAQAAPTTTAAEKAGVDPRTVRTDKAIASAFTPSQSLELDEDGWTKAERAKLAKRLKTYPAGPIRGQVFAGAVAARRDEKRVTAARKAAEEATRAAALEEGAAGPASTPKAPERKDLAGRVLPPTAIARWTEASQARAIYVALSDDLDAWDKFAEGASTFTDKGVRALRDAAAKFVSWLGDRLGHAWCPDCQGSGRRSDGRACKTCHARGFLTQREWELRAGDEAGGRDDD